MPTMILEGGRQAPAAPRNQRPVALVLLSEIPTPSDIGTRYYNAVAMEPNSQVTLGGIPGGILSVISNCPTSAVQGCFVNAEAFGWRPHPHPKSRINVDKVKSMTPSREVCPMSEVMQHLLAIQATNVAPEGLPEWMQLRGKSGKLFRPCGTAVGPRGACIGSPCPEGPCGLSQGGACVWSQSMGTAKAAPAPAPALAPPYSEPHLQEVDASEFAEVSDAPENGAPKRNSRGQFTPKQKTDSPSTDA